MRTHDAILFAALLAATPAARAELNVFACEPEWGALARELGGERVKVYDATTGLQDVHQIQARPSLIAKARSADLMVCTGAELELPTSVDRALGDIHPYGNPHLQTDPRNIAKVAAALAQRMAQLDPAHAAGYSASHKAFDARWSAALQRWQARAAPLRGAKVVAHHRSWPYLADWLGLEIVGFLEPKPGIPPSSAHLAGLLDALKGQQVRAIIRSGYEDPRPSQWLAERIHAPAVVVPQTVGAVPAATDLVSLYDAMLDALLGAR